MADPPEEQVYLLKQLRPDERDDFNMCHGCCAVRTPAFRLRGTKDNELCDGCYSVVGEKSQAGRDRRNSKRRELLDIPAVLTKELGIPPKYHRWTVADFTGPIADALLGVYRGDPALITLAGDTGTGKTSALYALMKFAWGETFGQDVPKMLLWTAWSRLMHGRQFGGREGLVEHKRSIEWLSGTKRLVMVDDIMSGGAPDKLTLMAFMEVLEAREAWDLPTLLTTNLALKEMAAIDDRLASRMAPGWTILNDKDHRLEMTGDDRRAD